MHTLLLGIPVVFGLALQAPPPAQKPPSQPPPTQAPTAQAPPAASAPRPAPRTTPVGRPAINLTVTDRTGVAVPGASVLLTGPVERSAETDHSGAARFANLRAGLYRLRVERQGFLTLERELALAGGGRPTVIDLALNPAPAPPPKPAAPSPAPARTAEPPRPVGEPRAVDVLAFAEKNPIERDEGQRITLIGCTGYAATRVVQLREPLEKRSHQDADVVLYAAKGGAIVNMNSQEFGLSTGGLMVVPRGIAYSIAPRGRGPVVLLSILSGPPCTEETK